MENPGWNSPVIPHISHKEEYHFRESMGVVVVGVPLLSGPNFHGYMQSNELAGLSHEAQALSWSMAQGTVL